MRTFRLFHGPSPYYPSLGCNFGPFSTLLGHFRFFNFMECSVHILKEVPWLKILLKLLPGSLVHKTTLGGLLTVTEDPIFPFASVFPEFPPEAEVTTLEPCSGCNGPILLIVGC